MAELTRQMRVVIADDSLLFRSGLGRLLADEDIDVAATVGNADELLEAVRVYRPDLAVIDVRMPPTFTNEGLQAALNLRERYPDVSVLVLSQYIEVVSAGQLLSRGAQGIGYLLKDRVTNIDTFVDTIRRVADGDSALDPDVVSEIFAHRRDSSALDRVSPREAAVLAHMADGLSNAAIADRLAVTERAVEKHIRSIFAKLDLPPDEQAHNRRVVAVLRYLDAAGAGPATWVDLLRGRGRVPS